MKLCPHSLYGYEQNEQQCAHTNVEDVCSELSDATVLQVEVIPAQQVAVEADRVQGAGAISGGGGTCSSTAGPGSGLLVSTYMYCSSCKSAIDSCGSLLISSSSSLGSCSP